MNKGRKLFLKRTSIILSVLVLLAMTNVGIASAIVPGEKTFTTTDDFNTGILTNTVVTNDAGGEVKLDDTTAEFGLIWVAVSTKGTIVKIDTNTGKVLGEYLTSPDGQPKDPSRTTVDNNGSVWVTNRAGHSVTRVVTKESGLWVDRNGNGVCDTSAGYGDIKPWTNAGGVDTDGGADTAQDECIINYTLVNSWGTRHVSIDQNNDVWVSGTGGRIFDLLDGNTGAIKRTEGHVGYGGYGGLIDRNNVIWSALSGYGLLRWDTSNPLSGPVGGNWQCINVPNYGLAIDPSGNIWTSTYGNGIVSKIAPDGTVLGQYNQGNYYAQGVVADANGDIWVAHSLSGSSIGHLKNNGQYVGSIAVPAGPTGVAVDAAGKIWATCYYGRNVVRIDPNAGPIGADGVTHVGAVDFISPDLGGNLYNYSDMTGSTIQGAPTNGTWTATYDSGIADAKWKLVDWTADTFGGALKVEVASSINGTDFTVPVEATDGAVPAVADGQYLKVIVTFTRANDADKKSPVLYDIMVKAAPPVEVTVTNPTVTVDEGDTAENDGTWAGADSLGAAPLGAVIQNADGTWNWSYLTTDGTSESGPITITAAQGSNSVTADFNLIVNNVAPSIPGGINAPTAPQQVNTEICANANFIDPGTADTHTGTWDWGDGTTSTAVITETSGSGSSVGTHAYTEPGVYTITLTIVDKDGASATETFQYIVVYDPSAGFVTGGGAIYSPAGAYAADPDLEGKATFGFVSKYLKGSNIPSGNTEFQFHAASFNFKSTSYEWLVIAGSKAQFKGEGTINNSGSYKFMLTAVDGDKNPDKFRIKIWDAVSGDIVYDNQMGQLDDAEPATTLTQGNIVIHK